MYNVTMFTNSYYNEFFEIGQQKIYFDLYQLGLPSDDPVYSLIKVLEELNYAGLITLKTLFIDGTKIEANANRYAFVWRGSINYHLAGLLDRIDAVYDRYNAFLAENAYDQKYEQCSDRCGKLLYHPQLYQQ